MRSTRGPRAADLADLSRFPDLTIGCERVGDLAVRGEQALCEPECRWRHRRHQVAHSAETGKDVVGPDGRRHVLNDHAKYGTGLITGGGH